MIQYNINKKIKCQYCGSTNIAKILYGLPAFSSKLDEDLKMGKVVLGGCCVTDDDPDRHCNNCNKDFHSNSSKQKQHRKAKE